MLKKLNNDTCKSYICILTVLSSLTFLSGSILSSAKVSADDSVVDQVTITVPVSCSLSGTGMNTHNAEVLNGTYEQNIGTTTLKAYCNDTNGFSIFATGFTGDVVGATNSNKLVGTSVTSNATIATGTATSGDTSNWAMKLATPTSPAPTYPITIATGFDAYHAVPNNYTRVAYRASGTDIGQVAEGSTLTTTYAAYISRTQYADTYSGKVKYTLIHPSDYSSISSEGITAVFQAYGNNSIVFPNGEHENTVIFRQLCEDPNDSSTCKFIVTEGEYMNPVGYKGVWYVPMPDGSGGYDLQRFEIQNGEDEWLAGLEMMGGDTFLGQTVPVYAYVGNAVIYDGNGATAGDMSQVASRFGDNSDYESDEAALIAPNYYKTGYGFAGWSTSSSATPTNGVTIYGPNETVEESDFTFDANGNVTLYAVWVQSTGNMQNFSCSSLSSGAITALTDTRDGNVYTVGKLADGNCWMMENLRLNGDIALNASNTNNPAINYLGNSQDSWCTDDDSACIDQSIINTNNTNMGGTNNFGHKLIPQYNMSTFNNTEWYGYGNYYNWYAATAGNGTFAVTSGNVNGDICPAGWSMPTGYQSSTNKGQFSALDLAIGGTGDGTSTAAASNRWRSYPNNFVYSGRWYDSVVGLLGYYWSRTARLSDYASYLNFSPDYVYPTYNYGKGNGFAVRCLAQ